MMSIFPGYGIGHLIVYLMTGIPISNFDMIFVVLDIVGFIFITGTIIKAQTEYMKENPRIKIRK